MASGGGGKKTIWDVVFNVGGKSNSSLKKTFKEAQEKIKDAQEAAKKAGENIKSFFDTAGKLAFAAVAGFTAATAGIVAMADSVAESAGNVSKMVDETGIGVEAYQDLQYAMKQCGVESGTFDEALKNFNTTVKQGAQGNEEAAKALNDVGLSAQKLSQMSPEKAFERISDYMNTLPNDAARTQMAVTLFGESAGAEMVKAMKMGSRGMREYSEQLSKTGNKIDQTTIEAAEAYKRNKTELTETVSGMKTQFISGAIEPVAEAFKHLSGGMQDLIPDIRELGEKFGEWLGNAVRMLPEIISKIKETAAEIWANVTAVVDFVGGWENVAKIAGVIMGLVLAIKAVKAAISIVIAVKKAWAAAQAVLNVVLSANPIGLIIAGIAALIGIIILLVENWDTVKEAVAAAASAVADFFKPVIDWFKEAWNAACEFFRGIWDSIVGFFQGIYDWFVQIAQAYYSMWVGVFTAVGEFFQGVWDGIVGFFQGIFDWFVQIAQSYYEMWMGVFTAIGDFFQGVWDGIVGFFQGIYDWFVQTARSYYSMWMGIFKVVGNAFKKAWDNIVGFFQGIYDWFVQTARSYYSMWMGVFTAVGDFFQGVWDGIVGFFQGIYDWFVQTAQSYYDMWSGVFTAIGEFFQSVWDGIVGFFQGIYDWFVQTAQSYYEMWSGVFTAVGDFFQGVWEKSKKVVRDFVDKALGFFKPISDFFQGIGDKIASIFGGKKTMHVEIATTTTGDTIPQHGDGGIFAHRHIAEIAERGAEAVVPLNNSANGQAIWERAGELGGYINRDQSAAKGAEQTGKIIQFIPPSEIPRAVQTQIESVRQTSASPIQAVDQSAGETPSEPSIIRRTGEQIANNESGRTSVVINYAPQNTFYGKQDEQTVDQIIAAERRSADDLETRLEEIAKNKRRVSY